jgi:iron complex transport system substrate-binding protein
VIGVSDTRLVNTPAAVSRIEAGQIESMGRSATLNIEMVISRQPDLVLTSASGDMGKDIYPNLVRAGVPIVLSSSYMEAHPLARVEWIKFYAEFFDKREEAKLIFDQIETRYLEMKKLANTVANRPTVFCNIPWGGTWYTPGGNSYKATLIEDAGGKYLWDDDEGTASLPLDFESVYIRAFASDFWFETRDFNTLDALGSADSRYKKFRSFQKGQVYNGSKRMNAYGGYDLWERGTLHPEEILADYIKIFHPELLPDHELIYYRQLQ